MTPKKKPFSRQVKKHLVIILASALAVYVLLSQFGGFSDSFRALKSADIRMVLAACGAVVATYILSTVMYWVLAWGRLDFLTTFWVQVANGFANRLLPAGLGGLTLNTQYLRKNRHTLGQAVAVASMNNILGFVGHSLLIVIGLFASGQIASRRLEAPHFGVLAYVLICLLAIGALGVLAIPRLRKAFAKVAREVLRTWAAYRKRPLCLMSALVVSVGITMAYALVLFFCTEALGVELTFWHVFEVFTFTVLASVAVPTPGGLGGAEAGIAVGLITYNVATPTAVAVALLYRLLTYWLPMLPGLAAFLAIRKRYL